MSTEQNQNGGAPASDAGDLAVDDKITLSKDEYTKLVSEHGSFKRSMRELKEKLSSVENQDDPQKPSQQSQEPDYAKLAFLNSTGVNHPDDQRVVMEEAARLKLSLNDVLNMEHIKSKLATQNDARLAEAGMPNATGRKGGQGRGTVEYYLAHPDQVPDDLDLHNQVIDAKMKQEVNANKFSSEMFVG